MIRTTSNNPALSKKQFLTATTTMKLGEEADSGIVVDPVSIKFDSVQPGVLYVMTFSVRNVTKVAQRIRISPPKCGYFALNYIPAGPIAAGLDIRAEIECQIPANTKEVVFTDKVVISMGKSIFEIPIYACKPSATVKFDKTVDFGSIIQGQSNQKEIVFENVGSIKGSVKIIAPTNQNLKVTPTKFDLEPIGSTNSVGVVKLSFDAQQSGFFRELLKVSIVGTLEDQLIDISGQVIEQKLLLLTENNKGSLEIADFGNLFFGQTKTINAYLVNTGPLPLSFLINYDEEEDANVPSSRSEEEGPTDDPTSSYSKSLNISPMDGMIKPFSQIVLSITFNPVVNVPGRGFVKQYLVDNKNPKSIVRRATIECTDLDQSIMLTLQGSAVSPSVSVIPSMLRFGDCPVNDRRDILLSLENNNKFPTTFQFPKVANFKFEPSKGILSAMETKSIIASFSPPQLGKFKTTLKLSIADGLTVKELKMLGESTDVGQKKQLIGGTDKLPDDFRVSHKFVNSEEEAEARHEKRTLREMKEVELKKLLTAGKANTLEDMATAIDLTNDPMANLDALSSTSSAERDHIYGLTEKSLVKALPEDHPHIVRQQHNKLYNTFLQQSHLKRVETRRNQVQKKLTSRSSINPNDPDMGMDRGLEEPKLHIPKAGEPLWLATGTKDGESGGGVNRMPIDENRLIQKKYNSTPATQAEQRDCSVELSPDGLKLVQSSHKVIDFGKVNVGSLSAKNFSISNDLNHAIIVKVEELEPELQHSKALCQIIPSGCVAGFDIYFSSKNLGKFKKAFTWKINGIHTNKVFVMAEVVPIELEMSRTDLIMEFPAESVQPTLTQDIMLTNPGNASADFLWGSAGAFQCNPEKGSIAAGKSAVISITWSPLSGKRSEEELGLHVTSGIDQTLRVRGILKETKADFVEKRLLLGTMAVGTEKKLIAQIRNSGEHPLSFFINPLDERLGISLTPERECILPGEILPLNITIIPKFAMNYDNTTISAKVLGGKQISLKMAGSSIIPQLTFAQDAFTFGTVAIGSEHRLPFIITNKTGITATLVLDLYQQQDFKPCLKYSLDEGYLPHTSQSIKSYQEDEKGIEMKQIDVKRTEDTTTASPTRRSKKKSHSNVWWISIPPNGTMEADLIFRPTSVRAHIFKLKLNLQGMVDDKTFYRDVTASGQASILELSSNVVDFGDRVVSRDPLSRVSYFLETTIKNVGMKSGFSFEVRELPEITKEFGGKSATHSTDAADDPSNQIFFVSPTRGDLAPGGSIAIRITFQPQSSGDYFKRLEVYIKGQDDKSRPYTTILCTGSGLFPRLSFDRDQVHLPTVPLGVTSRASFAIVNNGYSSLGIAYKISPNIPVLVDVSFPDGNSVGIMVEQIRVHLAAKSEIPISWSGKIEFYDQDGERFVIAVSGCSDNCLLTNYPFVRSYHDVYGFIGLEDQPVKYMKKNDIAELRQLEAKRKEELRKQRSLERQRAVANAGDGDLSSLEMLESKKGSNSNKSNRQIDNKSKKDVMVNIDDDGPGADSGLQHEGVDLEREDLPMHMFDPTEIIFLLHLLNKNICRKPFDLSNFPVCITDTQGDIFVDCLEQMSGKRIPFVKSNEAGDQVGSKHLNAGNKPRNSEKQTRVVIVNRLVFKYQQMINFVIGHGALLGHINPISLLGVEDYLIAQEFELTKDKSQRFTTAMLSEKRKLWEQQWPETCQKAWLDFIYQAVKVYVLSRINFKDYARTPGVVLHPKEEAVYRDLVDAAKNTAEKGKSKKRVPTIPKCYQPSNVYSHSEALLLAWASYHLEHAGNMPDEGAPGSSSDSKLITFNKRVTDLDTDFKDLMGYFQLIHSHLPDITKEGELLSGYTAFDRTKKEDNYSVLSDALKHLQMDLGVRYQDIVSSSRSILLLLLHFYLYLPNLIPKTKVEFTGQLGYPIAKKIELKNPSQKPVAYNVTLWGSADFSIDTTKVVIPPESCVEFSVALRAKFCETVSSKLTFWGVREAGVAGATMSFKLISNIIGRRPVEKITRNVFLYDLEHFSLSVRSPFSKDGTFHLQLKVLHAPISIEESIRGPGSRKVNREDGLKPIEINRSVEELQNLPPSERKVLEEEIEIEHIFQQPFWCFDENIPLSKTSVRHLNVSMLPFVLGKYVCQLIFVEKDIGEFSYEIHVEVGLPKASDKLDFSALYGGTTLLSLKLASKNSGFEKALSLLTETRIKNPNKKIRARSSLQSLLSSPIISEDSGQSNFLIEFLPSFFIYKKQLPFVSEYISNKGKGVIKDVNKYKKCLKTALEKTTVEETNNSATLLNTVLLAFAPEKAGTYCTTAVLYSKDNKVDVRVVDLSISVGMPDSKIVLEFRGPAREKITQEIPVKNESEQDWNLTINITGKSFYAQKALFVPAMSECPLEICFRSPVSGKFDGVIQLKNIDGMDAFQYNLTGIAEEPLAAANFYFQSSARSSKVCTLPLNELISNDRPNQNWKVETDLPYISGPEAVTVTSSGGKYEFTVNSPVGGMLNGYISFTEQESGEFVWYTVSVEVTSPLEETAIEVRTTVRSAVAIEITLENPTSETLVFDVSFHGDGLIGETTFSLEPSSKDTSNKPYELIYSPLIAGNFIGKISFHNEMAGELWYKLKLTADPAPPVDLGTIESMLGSANFLHVPVENPLPEDITFMVKISNPDLFYSGSDKISLGPYEQSHFNVFYRPASLTDVETCSVVLSNKNFGEIQYKVSGTGLLPGLMPQVQIDAALGEIGSTTIVFRNPFAHPLPVDVVLSPSNIQQTKPKSNRSLHRDRTGDNQSDKALQNLQAFQLLLKNPNGVVIAPKSSLHIAISFAPERLAQFEAVLEIRSNVVGRSLLWCYPIYGMAEAGALQRIPPMVTMCKTSLVKEFFVPLEGISEYDVQNVSEFSLQDFSVEVDIKDEKYKAMILRSFRPQIVGVGNIPDNYELPGIGRGPIHYQLSCRLLFEPLRTFATSVDLIVICQNRGKWRLTLDLEATDPEADDVVRLVAPVGGADKVTFRLSNRFLGYSHFQAYFSVKSSSHFRVSPVSGVLAPFGSDGTPFVVTFAPTSYGNIEVGYLTIVTEDAQWKYEVRGSYPDTTVNPNIKSKVNSVRQK